MHPNSLVLLPFKDSKHPDLINAVIETPQGSRNKYAYDQDLGIFRLSKVLPAGSEFPFSFGFIPTTLAEDGDPVDILVLADEPVPVGCVVPTRLIGILKVEQGDKREMARNDRLIGVAAESRDHEDLKSLKDVGATRLREIEHFFESYHQMRAEKYRMLGRGGPIDADKALKRGLALFNRLHNLDERQMV